MQQHREWRMRARVDEQMWLDGVELGEPDRGAPDAHRVVKELDVGPQVGLVERLQKTGVEPALRQVYGQEQQEPDRPALRRTEPRHPEPEPKDEQVSERVGDARRVKWRPEQDRDRECDRTAGPV